MYGCGVGRTMCTLRRLCVKLIRALTHLLCVKDTEEQVMPWSKVFFKKKVLLVAFVKEIDPMLPMVAQLVSVLSIQCRLYRRRGNTVYFESWSYKLSSEHYSIPRGDLYNVVVSLVAKFICFCKLPEGLLSIIEATTCRGYSQLWYICFTVQERKWAEGGKEGANLLWQQSNSITRPP